MEILYIFNSVLLYFNKRPFTSHYYVQCVCFSNLSMWCLRFGLDLYEGKVCDNKKAGVIEPAISKIKSLKFATEAAITILRIDDMIKLEPERKEGRNRNYEDDY